MAWSDGKQPVNPPQQQTKTQLISELADENSQLYELLNEQKKLPASVSKSVQQQKLLNERNSETLVSLTGELRNQAEAIRTALPSEVTRQISGIYNSAQTWILTSEQMFTQALDSQLAQVQGVYNTFNTELEATNAKAEKNAQEAAARLEALTQKAEAHSRIKEWIMTGLLAVVYVLAILACISVLIGGGAAAAINQAAVNIGGTGGLIFNIGVQWVLPVLMIGVPLIVFTINGFRRDEYKPWLPGNTHHWRRLAISRCQSRVCCHPRRDAPDVFERCW